MPIQPPSQLSLFLCEVAQCERKLEYCRQLIAENMNFSPEFLFRICLTEQDQVGAFGGQTGIDNTVLAKGINVHGFTALLDLVGLNHMPSESVVGLFDYFDHSRISTLSYDCISESMLPRTQPALSKAVQRRNAKSMQWTPSLKSAIKQFFERLDSNLSALNSMNRSDFQQLCQQPNKVKEALITESQLKQYLAINQRYSSPRKLVAISRELERNLVYGIDYNAVRQYIREQIRKVETTHQGEKNQNPSNLNQNLRINTGQSRQDARKTSELLDSNVSFRRDHSRSPKPTSVNKITQISQRSETHALGEYDGNTRSAKNPSSIGSKQSQIQHHSRTQITQQSIPQQSDRSHQVPSRGTNQSKKQQLFPSPRRNLTESRPISSLHTPQSTAKQNSKQLSGTANEQPKLPLAVQKNHSRISYLKDLVKLNKQ